MFPSRYRFFINLSCAFTRLASWGEYSNVKSHSLLCSAVLVVMPFLASAGPILVVGTPANSQLSTPTGASPSLAFLFNFDALTPFSTFSPTTFASQGVTSISSADGLIVEPYSTQSFPNELYDNSSNGTASITVTLAHPTDAIGIGIADSDPVSVTFQALGAGGTPLGSPFVENLATTESTINTGNGYYLIEDTSYDLYGMTIVQNTGNANYSGLAIDDLQMAPEPSSLMLMAGAAGALVCLRRRKRP